MQRRADFYIKHSTQKIYSENMRAAVSLHSKFLIKMQKHPPKLNIIKKNILKQIGMIYTEKLKFQQKHDMFHVLCYDYFLSQFGLKNVAEFKILQLYEGIFYFQKFKNKSCPRIELFGRFLRLYNPFLEDEVDYYIDVVNKLDESQSLLSSYNEVVYVPVEKCKEPLRQLSENLSKVAMQNSLDFLAKHQVFDKLKSLYVIDLDLFMGVLIGNYNEQKNIT